MSLADSNVRRFVLFRVLFNARFYYPVYAVLFLDYGISLDQLNVLNFVWAIAIVGLEVPSGAVADQFGRRRLVVFAAICMVVEMALLGFVPLGNGAVLFTAMLLNRILSGAAEASASGADEALVFDSLAAEGRGGEWPRVLEKLGRWQSLAFVFAMLIGGCVYDAALLHRVAGSIGIEWSPDPRTTMRFPVYLTLANAVLALAVTLGMREPPRRQTDHPATFAGSVALMKSVARWLWAAPLALFLIFAGLLHDSVIRLVLTFNSNFYRLIDIPPAWYGVIGAVMGLTGFAIPPLARRLVEKQSIARNIFVLAAITLIGLIGLMLLLPRWGVFFVLLLGSAMGLLNFFLSHYLNALADPASRATLLSFRGLAFNLGYGFVSLAFAGLLHSLTPGGVETAEKSNLALAASLPWLPGYFLLSLVPLAIFARRTRCLGTKPESGAAPTLCVADGGVEDSK